MRVGKIGNSVLSTSLVWNFLCVCLLCLMNHVITMIFFINSFFVFVHNLYSFCVRVFANEMHWYSELFNCKFLLFSILSNWLPVLSCLQRRLCHQPTCSSGLEAPKVTVSKFWCVVICCF